MPGMAIGAVARKPMTRQPATIWRAVTYAIATAIAVPMVAVAVPRITVFLSASEAADNSNSTKLTFCRVKLWMVREVLAEGENAGLKSAPYGKNTGWSSNGKQSAKAGQRQRCSGISGDAPYFPPTTE